MLYDNPAFATWKGDVPLDHLSASSVNGYLQCGLSWKLSHLDKVSKIGTASWFVFGSAFHRGLEPWWQGNNPKFSESWQSYKNSKVDYYGRGNWESFYSMGMKMTSAAKAVTDGRFEIIRPEEKKARIEKTEDVDLGFIILRRRMDVILEARNLPILTVDTGTVAEFSGKVLIDVKTSGRQYNPDSINYSGQLKTYAVPSHGEAFGDKLSAYLVVTKTINPVVQIIGKRYSKDEIKGQLRTIRQVAEQIKKGIFIRNEGDHCQRCDYFALCYKRLGWEDMYRKNVTKGDGK